MREHSTHALPSASRSKTKKRNGNSRSWVSINLVGALMGMAVTGVLSYGMAYNEIIAGIHTWFGIAFILLMAFHLRNNFRVILTYLTQDKAKLWLTTSVVSILSLTLGVILAVPPFSSVLSFGQELRKSVTLSEGSYQTLTTHIGSNGLPISIELRKGEHYESEPQALFLGMTYTTVPQVAFWIEDLAGHYIDTLYVTQKTSNGGFIPNEDLFGLVSRPEALPYWAHQRGVKYKNNLMVPDANNTDLDGVTGATPLGNYDINSKVNSALRQFRVMMEINRSYDFNSYYTKDKYPQDPIYSGSGSSGQPSVIYAASIDLDDPQSTYLMKPIGHGHYSGANGILYTNMTGIDTALQLVQRVIIDI
ncbi:MULTISPECIES: DUF4405 domain-containing protein [unclassified Agarivorans]|uniref:DUF4405 domain-containing protein n=1 Tax=unclassified Agarivorans TaxID=2636026 RepID=UPI003D7C6E78